MKNLFKAFRGNQLYILVYLYVDVKTVVCVSMCIISVILNQSSDESDVLFVGDN